MRTDGYLPIEDYAIVGDGRTSALVGRDGSVDWLCLPDGDSPPVLDRLLDADRGGCFELAPVEPYEVVRRYRAGTNVLETTFTTASGSVRVTDAMTRGDERARQLVRVVDGRSGAVALTWRFEPRQDFGRARLSDDVRLHPWDAGDGAPTVREGERVTFAVRHGGGTPSRDDVERALERTSAGWMDWSGGLRYDGPWREQVVRSALCLKLLQYEPTGAILAAPTTSLPERIGGDLNWDYRFSWLRDGIYTMRALLFLGCGAEAEAFFRWSVRAVADSAPELHPLYRLDGSPIDAEEEVDVPGYRGSRPVRVGNAAAGQLQLDNYGHLLESASRLHGSGRVFEPEVAAELARVADETAAGWRDADAGIWELRGQGRHFVQSKAMCWTALDRAASLGEAGALPDRSARWREEAAAVREWIESDGWSDRARSYRRAAGSDEVDGSLLSLALCAYSDADEERFRSTVAAVVGELGAGGPLLYRMPESRTWGEGAFLACSFWLVDALGRAGRVDEGHALMARLVELANDVGLYSEELDPETGAFLGNFPQALTHLALVNAAVSLAGVEEPA
ncbi:MAG TPA: glycoside hydrolase family 15 protein [Gaiellaceae bacterium]|nr:glycoside hydrolase family 15 protein [Gaiellaceae bacterium]